MNEHIKKQNPRHSVIVREQLADLNNVLASFNSIIEKPFSIKTSIAAMEQERDFLYTELRAAELFESGSDFELVLDGDPVKSFF